MELSWLDDFLALAETGHFSRAAEARNLTQPAFSRRIRALEQWMGTELFDRNTQPVSLTDAGEAFLPAAKEVRGRLNAGRDEARAAAGTAACTLTFAATYSLSLNFFPHWLRDMEKRVSMGPTRLISDTRDACERLLSQNQVQFMLCHAPVQARGAAKDRQFRSTVVDFDVLRPVCAKLPDGTPRFALPGQSPLPYLAYSEGSAMGQAVEDVLTEKPASLHPTFTSHLASVLRSMTLDGRGLAWLPYSMIKDDQEAGRLVDAGNEDWSIPLEIRLYRPRARLSPVAETFWSAVTG